jgi:hypothetical protein
MGQPPKARPPRDPQAALPPSIFARKIVVHHTAPLDKAGIDDVKRAVALAKSAGNVVTGCTACMDFDILTTNDGVCEFCGTVKRRDS